MYEIVADFDTGTKGTGKQKEVVEERNSDKDKILVSLLLDLQVGACAKHASADVTSDVADKTVNNHMCVSCHPLCAQDYLIRQATSSADVTYVTSDKTIAWIWVS